MHIFTSTLSLSLFLLFFTSSSHTHTHMQRFYVCRERHVLFNSLIGEIESFMNRLPLFYLQWLKTRKIKGIGWCVDIHSALLFWLALMMARYIVQEHINDVEILKSYDCPWFDPKERRKGWSFMLNVGNGLISY